MDQFAQSKRQKGLFGSSSSSSAGEGGGDAAEGFEKNILLIIDPQNDFSDVRDPYRAGPGKKRVEGFFIIVCSTVFTNLPRCKR